MRAIAVIVVLLAGVIAAAQSKSKESALRKILDDEITTWKQGDTDGYSEHFAADGTFTNVMGMFLPGGRHSMTVTRSFLRGRSAALSYGSKSYRYGFSHLTLPSARP